MTKPKLTLDIETRSLHPLGRDHGKAMRLGTEAHQRIEQIRDAIHRSIYGEPDVVVEGSACTNTIAPGEPSTRNEQLMVYGAGLDYGATEARIYSYMMADTHFGALHPDQHFTNEGAPYPCDVAMVIGDELHMLDFKTNVIVVSGGDQIHHTHLRHREELDKRIGESLAKSIRQEAEATIKGYHRQPKKRDWEQRTKKGRRK